MRYMFRFIILTLFLLLGQACTTNSSIEGTVTGQNGKTPALVHIDLLPLGQERAKPLQSIETTNGHFKIKINDDAFFTLHIAAVNHYDFNIPLLPGKAGETIKLQITPKGYDYKSDFKDSKIIGDWNNFSMAGGEALTLGPDGTYSYERPDTSTEVGYQLLNVENEGHSINGTQTETYKYDGGGDFRSVIKTENGKFKVTFDPAKLKHPADNTVKIQVSGDAEYEKIIALSMEIDNAIQNRRTQAQKYAATHNGTTKGFIYDFSTVNNKLESAINAPGAQLLNRFAAISKINFQYYRKLTAEELKNIAHIVKIDDPLWELAPNGMIDVYKTVYGKDKALDKLYMQSDKIKAPTARGFVIASRGIEAMHNGNSKLQRKLYNQMKSEYGTDRNFSYAMALFNPDNRIAVGKPVPDFEVTLLHSDKTVSNKSLLGGYYMIDFWAVWCGPCRGEMPGLDKAYKKFKDKNFKVLSLSFDAKESDIDKYRKETWPMPWMHSFLKGGFKNPISKRFEVRGIPKPIFVGPDGKIMATEMDLRGENLEKTLAKYLN